MDINTPVGALVITVLRLLHIVCGVIWVGSGILISMYIGPALGMSGVDSSKVMRTLYTKTGFDKIMPIVSITTTVAGLIMYALIPPAGGFGIVLGIGAVFGLLAFGHGFATLGSNARKYAALIKEAGDTPTNEQETALKQIEAKLMRHGKISMWLGVAAVVFMAGARYVQPFFG